MEEIAVLIVIFGTLFGIIYLYFSTRNKERMALIEKGADASIFVKGNQKNAAPFWKVIILNLSLLLMGIGLGVFMALILDTYTNLDSDAVYPATIFFMAGVGLFVGFNLTKKLDNE
ncbi:MAG: DUF6249 domain-containing protein [Polaribacter sp.]|uniref:DUF6249 domain-containing protein n=1 Tax=Polaribacter sp. TaxID=1920175 RepID=UPI003BB0727D